MKIHSTKKKARSGTLEAAEGPDGATRYRGRLRLADGTKSQRVDLPEGLTEAEARSYLASLQRAEDATGQVLAAKRDRAREDAARARKPSEGETCDDWHDRFLATRTLGNVEDSRGRWRRWISPILGSVPIAAVGREDVERVRDHLDAAIRRFRAEGRGGDRLMPKSALNVWSVLTTAFKHACSSKDRGIRVRAENPCIGVLPPEPGASRLRAFLYPTEVAALLSCADVPLRWRQIYAVAIYTYLRPGELWELRWRDVDLSAELVGITRAWDWEEEEAKAPKTRNGIRSVPLEPAIVPLLAALREGQPSEAHVFPELRGLNENKVAARFRAHLALAGVDRPILFEDTATHMPVNFRSCRDTGITWLALAGVEAARIQRRAGHDDFDTTLGYVKSAEDLSGRMGTPFPELPPEVCGPAIGPAAPPMPSKHRTSLGFGGAEGGSRTPDLARMKRPL